MPDENQDVRTEESEAIESIALDSLARGNGDGPSLEEEDRAAGPAEEPITAYCDRKRLGLVERLRLFQQVCRIVDGFHRRAAIHGGLTPDLVAVSEGETPQVSVHPAPPQADRDVNQLRYASPEQVVGEPVTIATDVYSLGVLLYELLTGRYPYRISSPDLDEIFNAISVQSPERPGRAVERPEEVSNSSESIAEARRTSTAKLKRMLTGDLELVILRAMRKDPELRYTSAERLAADLQAFLLGRPVDAHRDSRRYRASKFVRRHWIATTLAALAVVTVLSGGIAAAVALSRVQRERNRYEVAAQTARTTLNRLFEQIEKEPRFDEPGLPAVRTSLLETFLRFYESRGDHSNESLTTLAEDARALARVGRINWLIGLPEVAAWQYQRALECYDKLASREPGASRHDDEIIDVLSSLGEITLTIEGRQAEARPYLESALSLIETRPHGQPVVGASARALARVLQGVAELESREGRLDEARAAWKRVMEIATDLTAKNSQTVSDRITLATAHVALGRLLVSTPPTLDQGISRLTRGIELRQKIVDEYPDRTDQRCLLALELNDAAMVHQAAGQLDLAARAESRSVNLLRQLDRQFPETKDFETSLYLAYDRMSRLENAQGSTSKAIEWSEQARTILERLVARFPKTTVYQSDLSRCHSLLGRLHQHEGHPDEALSSFQRAVDILESSAQLDAENSYQLAVNLSHCLSLMGADSDFSSSQKSQGERARRKIYTTRALAALSDAVAKSFASLEMLRDDPELAPLRDQPGFQKLLDDAANKAAAKPR